MKKFKEKIKNIEYNNLYPLFFTIIFILILIQYSFNSLDAIFYDLWTRGDFAAGSKDNIVVITMDEESDQFLGEIYPYTYATHNRILSKLTEDKPSIISYMVPMLEPENSVDKENLKSFHDNVQSYKSDGGIFRFGTDKDAWGSKFLLMD